MPLKAKCSEFLSQRIQLCLSAVERTPPSRGVTKQGISLPMLLHTIGESRVGVYVHLKPIDWHINPLCGMQTPAEDAFALRSKV